MVPSADTVERGDLAGETRARCLHHPAPARGCGKATLLDQLSRFPVPPAPAACQAVPGAAPPHGILLHRHASSRASLLPRVHPGRAVTRGSRVQRELYQGASSQKTGSDTAGDLRVPGLPRGPGLSRSSTDIRDPRLAARLQHASAPALRTPCCSPELPAAADAAWFPSAGFRPGRTQTRLLGSLQGSADGSSSSSRRRPGRRAPLADRWWAEGRAAHRLS